MAPDRDKEPEVEAFLQFLDQDILMHPERLRAIPEGLYQRLLAVTAGVEVILDDPIEGLVAL
jgi:hypothetical protein